MTSQLDPTLPLPSFCKTLRWPTSAAFKIEWLATTSVHFHHVGHLRNTLNCDEYDEPKTVVVGRDGQEISADAGRDAVKILETAEAGAEER